jgi:gliding motility-associated-like protein
VASTSGTCGDTDKQVITVTPAPKPIVSGNDSVCVGNSATLTATGATTYTWMPGSLSGSTVTVFPAATTTYTVSGSNGTCSHDTTFMVTVVPLPTGLITAKPDTICVGDSSKLIASGGTSYVWSPGGATTDSIWVKPASTATYTLSVTKNKCSATVTQTVTVESALTMSIKLSRDSICPKDSAILTVVGANTYKWSTGATTSTITVKPGGTTVYWVKCTNRCATDSLADSVHIMPFPKPVVSGGDSICTGSSTSLTATGATSYTWSPATGLSATTGASVTANPLSTTVYTIAGSNGHCTHDTTFTVVVSPYPTVAIVPSADSICAKDSAQLVASGGGTYSWSPGGMTSASVWVKPGTITTYTVTVTKNNCSAAASVTVVPIPEPVITASTNPICPFTNTVLSVTGGIGGGGYVWSTGATTSTITVKPGVNTTYTVTAYNKLCSKDTTITITMKAAPVVTMSNNSPTCEGQNVTINATGGGSYLWSTGATTSSITVPATLADSMYYVTVSNGCSTYDSSKVHVLPVSPIAACCNDTITWGSSVFLNATGAAAYVWTPKDSLSCFTCPTTAATPSVTTTYIVQGTDANGCSTDAEVTIVIECTKYIIPNVFTPNTDVKNPEDRVFLIKEIPDVPYSIEIFDRWGKKVFTSTNDQQPWNGQVNNSGANCGDGVYYYIITSTCNGVNRQDHGFVQLIR